MVYESKSHISVGFCEPWHLLFPIKNGGSPNSISLNVNQGSITHQESNNESQNRRNYLEHFGVFDIAKTEVNRKEAKDEDSQVVWIETQLFVEPSLVAPDRVGNAEYKTFGTADVFEADRPVHVECQNGNNPVLHPLVCNSVGYDAELNLLADVKRTGLIVNIL